MTTLEAPVTQRGETTIAPAVFERLAAQAATEIAGVEGEVQIGLGRFLPWTSGAGADAAVEFEDEGLVLDLTFNVAYPEPVRQVAERVRRHVAERVGALTGATVREVNITVPELVPTPGRRPRR